MTYDVLFAGVGGTILGTIVGAVLSAWLTHGFQKKLLNQQLEFQKNLSEEDAALRRKIYDEWSGLFIEFRNMINTRAAQLLRLVPSISHSGPNQHPERPANE